MPEQSIKIIKLIVKNYRGIGAAGLKIDIDNVVVLVGPNNSGKSTILKAFELVTKADTKIKIDDFFNKDQNNKPEIEIWSKVFNGKVHVDKNLWVNTDGIVRERWVWSCPDTEAERVGYRVDLDRWAMSSDDTKAPFSNDGAATAYRPSPTYISPFEQPDKQVDEIKKIISTEVYDSIKKDKKGGDDYRKLLEKLNCLQGKIKEEAKNKEEEISKDLGKILNELFPGTKVSLDVPQSNPDILSSYASVKDINFLIDNLSLENQGSGMQRVLLWSVLKMLAGREKLVSKKAKKNSVKTGGEVNDEISAERTKILLMDEPEICLHPESIRQAKEILYSLTSEGEWQIMITTHSPIFIDLSKDNTNIIRVHKEDKNVSLYRTSESDLSSNEKEKLKMLNIFDPYFAEFFFAKNVIIVEGDTEYTAFRKIINSNKEKYKDVHIIRARGKYTILPIIKILTKWGKDFSVLHDSDTIDSKQSWLANEKILNLVNEKNKNGIKIKLLSSKNNFESSFFGKEVLKDKPYNAYVKVGEADILYRVSKLLDYLCNIDTVLDAGLHSFVCEYKTIEKLKEFIK
jgi:putative ATP-dependent endonuclease of OLD family